MNQSSHQYEELLALCWACQTGELSDEEAKRLEQMVLKDDDACTIFIRYSALCANLEWEGVVEPGPLGRPVEYDPLPKADLVELKRRKRKKQRKASGDLSQVLLMCLPAVLLISVGLFLYFGLFNKKDSIKQIAKTNPPINITTSTSWKAHIASAVDVRWKQGEKNWKTGESIHSGDEAYLEQGLIGLHFSTGVKLLITAPATFQVTGENEISLSRGMLLAEVLTETGKGFTVKTPSSVNVDLGTIFGIAVDQKGTSVTQVFRGIVNSTNNLSKKNSSPSQTVQLTSNQRILQRTTGTSKQGIKNLAELFFVNFDHPDSSNKNRVAELIGIDKLTAKNLREQKRERVNTKLGIEDLEKRSMLPPYKVGHIWNRKADWNNGTKEKTTLGNPDNDSLGIPVWRYEYSEEGGGRLSNDPWYKKETQLLQWDDHWYTQKSGGWVIEEDNQSAVLISVDSFLDYQDSEINCNMLVRWINPTGKSVRLKLSGTVLATWRKKAISPIDLIIVKEKNDGAYEEIWSVDALPIGNGKQTVNFDSLQKTFWIKPEESLLFTVRTTGKKDWIRVVDSFQLELVEMKK